MKFFGGRTSFLTQPHHHRPKIFSLMPIAAMLRNKVISKMPMLPRPPESRRKFCPTPRRQQSSQPLPAGKIHQHIQLLAPQTSYRRQRTSQRKLRHPVHRRQQLRGRPILRRRKKHQLGIRPNRLHILHRTRS